MYCKNCGEQIEGNSKFCSFCGEKIAVKEDIEIENINEILISKNEQNQSEVGSAKQKSNIVNIFIFWVVFNSIALITSYSHISFFSDYSRNNTENFWPFVEYVTTDRYFEPDENDTGGSIRSGNWKENSYFHGIFVHYDWSEYLIYVGLMGLYLFVIRKKK